MNRLPISVVMISGAEASRIERTLASVAGWTSEIILVLNEDVRDGTDAIAARFSAQVFREPWKGYAAQKNSAAQKANQEWLLSLDADEVVSAALRDEIVETLPDLRLSAGFAAYEFPRCSLYDGRWIRHGDWYPDRKLRLWRRGQARWEEAALHEKVTADGKVGRLRHELLHYSVENVEQQIKKMLRYTKDFADGCRAEGRQVRKFDLVVRPPWRFVRGYLFRLGFLDGWQGFSISWTTAIYTYFRYLRALESQTPPPAPLD